MNIVIHVSRTVHLGLRLTPASELAGAHTPEWLWPRGIDGMTSTWRGGWVVVENGWGGGDFYRAGEVAESRGGGRPGRWVLISSVSTLNQGGESTRHRASAGEWRRLGSALVRLHPSVGGRPSVACCMATWPDRQRQLGRPDERERPRVGLC
jgi:hypothetical protein